MNILDFYRGNMDSFNKLVQFSPILNRKEDPESYEDQDKITKLRAAAF